MGLGEQLVFAFASRGLPRLPEGAWETLTRDSRELARDARGPTALRAADGRVVKLFRMPRRLSSQILSPLSRRFARNAALLSALGIAAPNVAGPWAARREGLHVATYPWLDGTTLRELVKGPRRDAALADFAGFLALLHAKGVVFRSLHFANVLALEPRGFALVDVADVEISDGTLGEAERLRNARHLGRYRVDVDALRDFGFGPFVERYLEASGLPTGARARLSPRLKESLELLATGPRSYGARGRGRDAPRR